MKNPNKHTCSLLFLVLLLSAYAPVAIAQAPPSGWSFTGCLNTALGSDHTATLLPNGKVLVAGGGTNNPYRWTNSAELYDPATGTWSYTGSLNMPRRGHTATLLTNGKVLVAGGEYGTDQFLTTAELYDPATGAWTGTGGLHSIPQSATLLANGKVLAVGFYGAEIYDPAAGTWTTVSEPNEIRIVPTATLLGNKKVLVIGLGSGDDHTPIAELYDPETGTWSAAGSLNTLRQSPSPPILLPNGKVLVTGRNVNGVDWGAAEIYDPASGTWSSTGAPGSYRWPVLLPNGKVLVASGISAELYDPATGRWSSTVNLSPSRNFNTAILLSNGNVLFTWEGSCGPGSSAALFDYRSDPSSAVASVSAASYSTMGLASEAIAAAFGAGLATTTSAAATLPLPTQLAGTSVKVTDSVGMERPAPLFFVSPNQVNYQIPPETAAGTATVTITSGDGMVSNGMAIIQTIAPGLFTANADGQGVAAALALRVKADGSQSYEPISQFDDAQNKFVARPLDLGPEGEQVYLVLFGTGIRHRSSLAAVRCFAGPKDGIAGVFLAVAFAGAQAEFVGLDQVNARLPRDLSGRGEVDVVLAIDNLLSNQVRINIK